VAVVLSAQAKHRVAVMAMFDRTDPVQLPAVDDEGRPFHFINGAAEIYEGELVWDFFGSNRVTPPHDSDPLVIMDSCDRVNGVTNKVRFEFGGRYHFSSLQLSILPRLLLKVQKIPDDRVQIEVYGCAGNRFSLERTSSFDPRAWTTLGSPYLLPSNPVVFITNSPAADAGFYRAIHVQ
jgi:hypothetical protein